MIKNILMIFFLLSNIFAQSNQNLTDVVKKEFDNPSKYYVDLSKKKKKTKKIIVEEVPEQYYYVDMRKKKKNKPQIKKAAPKTTKPAKKTKKVVIDNPDKYYVDMRKKKKNKPQIKKATAKKTAPKTTKPAKKTKKVVIDSPDKYYVDMRKKKKNKPQIKKATPKTKKEKIDNPQKYYVDLSKSKKETKDKKQLAKLNLNKNKKDKKKPSLADDPLFHAKRETGMSLHDAINRSILLSPKLKAAGEVVIQDKMKVDEAFAGHLPVVNLSGDTGYEKRTMKADDTQKDKSPALTKIYHYKKNDLYMTITENLWNGGAIEDAVDEKDAGLKASLYDYRDKLETLVVDTAKAYFKVVYAEIALKISKKNMKSYEKILKIVKIKEKNGAATKGDVNFIKANVDNAKTDLVQKQKELHNALAKYTYLLQVENNQDLPYEIDSPLYIADVNTSLQDAEKYNAKILKQRAYIASTRYGFLASRGSFNPKIDLNINGETRNEYDEGLGKRDKVTAIVTFNYNLYNGGGDQARAIRLLSKMREQKFLQEDLKRQLTFDIKTLNQSVTSLRDSLKLTEKEVLAAREVVKSYWISFKHGTQDLQALQLAQLNLSRAEQNYANYKRDLILNNYDLMQKTGVLLKFLNLKFKQDENDFIEDDAIFYNYYRLDDWHLEND